MTAVTLPPTPSLQAHFVSDGKDVAIREFPHRPPIYCASHEAAILMNCTMEDDCRCYAAENRVRCECDTHDVEHDFNRLQMKLPLKTPQWEMQSRGTDVIAKIPHFVAADVILNFNTTVNAVTVWNKANICSASNAPLEGCYQCAQGAVARTICKSNDETTAEIVCQQYSFVVPCTPKGAESQLRFHFNSARQSLNCSIQCGGATSYLVLRGILKYVEDVHTPLASLMGTNAVYREIAWPDFPHIFDVILSWYKTLIVALIVGVLALIASYMVIQWLSLSCLRFGFRLVRIIVCLPCRLLCIAARYRRRAPPTAPHEKRI
ncbi:unnamed protein product [Nippostrongylus brasiliensis]|uniref:Phlebovirus_G2 domain-containing protein n=1 Tax=Nippostrongylus brasiliensis TaxID=27835 RepID=A0A0N4XI27_NIPBR|nr:unnamed protein product [Nippostrongylus brasiliensis]